MPGIDGLNLCKEIRKTSETPIIFVSARDEEIDRILGLEIGADDYLTKPFSPRELVVRIKKILQRINKVPEDSLTDCLILKDLKIFPKSRLVKINEQEIKFTTKEYELLEFMVLNKNISFTREKLLEKVWGYDYYGDDRLVDDIVKRIRKKLNEVKSHLKIITIWGYGYRVDD